MFGILFGEKARMLRQQVEYLNRENDRLQNEADSWKRKADYFKEQDAKKAEQIATLNNALDELHKEDVGSLKTINRRLESQNKALAKDAAFHKDRADKALKQVEELKKQLADAMPHRNKNGRFQKKQRP